LSIGEVPDRSLEKKDFHIVIWKAEPVDSMLPFRMQREVEIVNKLGLHARPASEFVRCVIRFKSTITICKGEESFSAASILEVLSADLDCGARVVIEAVGPDEQEALDDLEALLLRFRDEEGGAQGN